jgi:competence protein ComEA
MSDAGHTRIRTRLAATLLAVVALGARAGAEANQASRAELETVKGIGPGLSASILQARQAGPFKDWADLVGRVDGIGRGSAARLSAAGLTVDGTPYEGLAAADRPAAAAQRQSGAASNPGTAP